MMQFFKCCHGNKCRHRKGLSLPLCPEQQRPSLADLSEPLGRNTKQYSTIETAVNWDAISSAITFGDRQMYQGKKGIVEKQ